MKAKIKINKKTGNKCLICYYDAKKCDWDARILDAEARLNVVGQKIQTICFPAKKGRLTSS